MDRLSAILFLIGVILNLGFARGAAAEESNPQTLRVGAILPLSGATADYGQAIVNSISLAQRDYPELFKRVSFTYEDAQYDAKKAVSAFQKLAHSDRVNLIFTWGVSFCKALAPLAERDKVATIGECIDPVSSRGKKYFLRFMNDSDQFLALTAKFLHARGVKRIGIVLAESAYLEEMFEGLKRNLMPGQSVEVAQRYQVEQMELRDAVARIRRDKYDAVGVFLSSGQISTFYRELASQNVKTLTFGTNFFESLSEVGAARGTMDGAFFANTEINPIFAAHYSKEFSSASQLAFAAPAYEFAVTTAKIANSTPVALSGAELLSAYRNRKEESGTAAGPYRFRETEQAGGYFEFPLTIKCIRGDSFKPIPETQWQSGACDK